MGKIAVAVTESAITHSESARFVAKLALLAGLAFKAMGFSLGVTRL